MEDIIPMSGRDLKRCWVMRKALEKRITQKKAAELMAVSERQVRRLIRRFREGKEPGIIHRLRGRPSNRKYPEEFKKKVLRLYEKHYEGFGPTLAQEKLLRRDKVRINRETLRKWLMEGQFWQRRPRSRVHRQWRERKAAFGEMVQMDGSHHDWLEGRGPKLVLMAYVDDATGNVFARFYDYEGTRPAMESFYLYARRYGLPQAIYLDRHSTYKFHLKPTIEDELQGKEPKSQFEAALGALGVQVIHAHSPQAKGRVERQFATFQDRLIKEMRLLGIKTKEKANQFLEEYLPGYNRRFARIPRSPVDLHRRQKQIRLSRVLSLRETHYLRNDNTVRHGGKLYQIKDHFFRRRPREIVAQERLNGKLHLLDGNRLLCYQEVREAPRKASKPLAKPKFKIPRPKPTVPAGAPIWRKYLEFDPKTLAPSDFEALTQHKDEDADETVSTYQRQAHAPERELIHT